MIGTASKTNHDYLRSLGAEPTKYGEGLAGRVRALEPQGVDVILDYVGGDALDSVEDVLRDGGTVASITDARARDEFVGIEHLSERELAAIRDQLERECGQGDPSRHQGIGRVIGRR